MATLVDPSGVHHPLGGTTVIGRTPGLPIVISDLYISGVHAEVRWTPDGWEIQHHSATYLNGLALPRLEWRRLAEGDKLSFGVEDLQWTLIDATPRAFASCGERRVFAIDGVLAFPEDADPEFVIGEVSGRYLLQDRRDLDNPDGPLVQDHQTFATSSGDVWTVRLPASLTSTVRLQVTSPSEARVRFLSDETEEAVSIELLNNGRRFPPRVHFRLLLQLARARRKDAATADKDPSEHGWCSLQVLSEELGIPEEQLNVYIYRARKAFEGAIGDHYGVVDRTGATGFVRIGFTDLSIVKAGISESPQGPKVAGRPKAR